MESNVLTVDFSRPSVGRKTNNTNTMTDPEHHRREFDVSNHDTATESNNTTTEKSVDTISIQTIERNEESMVENGWEQQYIDRVSRNLDEITRHVDESRREMKADVNTYMQRMDSKFDTTMNEMRNTQQRIQDDFREIRTDNNSTKKWIIGMAITIIISVAAMVLTVILKE